MKIPIKSERYNFETGKVEMMDTPLLDDIKQEISAALSYVTQCSASVVYVGEPKTFAKKAGVEFYSISGEFAAGDAMGDFNVSWTKTDGTEWYDVLSMNMRMGPLDWSNVSLASPDFLIQGVTNMYKLMLDANHFVPKHYREIEDILMEIRCMSAPDKVHAALMEKTDRISAILGNTLTRKEEMNINGKVGPRNGDNIK